MKIPIALLLTFPLLSSATNFPMAGQEDYASVTQPLLEKGMREMGAYAMLHQLTTNVGARLSGSPEAAKAVAWGQKKMEQLGFENVRLIPCMVPHWVRGDKEEFTLTTSSGQKLRLNGTALGMSVGTPANGITAEVIEVKSLEEAGKLGEKAKGKIVFFNGPMDPTLVSTFGAYGGAVGQRSAGASTVAKFGAVGVLVRSMTLDPDDEPHTGAMRYAEGVKKIPAAALGIQSAERLSAAIKKGPAKVRFVLSCKQLPDGPSANVVGEIRGSEFPDEVIVVGGHLDSWDKGTGAHDDGAGVCQSLEALRLFKGLGWKPKRTIRVVLFMNEENGGRGAAAYLDFAKKSGEKHIAALESDAGGFAPRGFNTSVSAEESARVSKWLPALSVFEAEKFSYGGGGGADVGPLREVGTVLFGLQPESQRYFDYHHSHKDTLDKVSRRELELGALAMATLVWLISEEGI
ncbi:MAG: M20/M25/M40 family metallo-hydrolase [Fimbriimonadaceae bacterium]|nr:M20/M25/M40 family metallo-hydrolase [Fimbriimonadaceae bacterium]